MAATSVELRFPQNNARTLPRVESATLRQREYQHEILIVTAMNASAGLLGLRTGDPVVADLRGANSKATTFYGYLHEVPEDVTVASDRARITKVVCVGATWVMKDERQRVWRNMTISEIARQILREYRLTADVEDSSIRIPQINQSGESDWAFLCRIAKQYGYVVYPTGVTVHFHTRLRDQNAKMRSAIQLRYRNASLGARSHIYEFKPTLGETGASAASGKAQRQLRNVDPRSAADWGKAHDGSAPFSTRDLSQPGIFTTFDRAVASTPQEVAAKVTGAAMATLWTHKADAEVEGYPHTTPTTVLYLDGLDGKYDGYWTVLGVDHLYKNRHQYRMKVSIGTESLGAPLTPFTGPSANVPIDSDLLLRRNTARPKARLQVPGGLTDVGILQGRGGPTGVVWVSDTDHLDDLPAETPTPWFIQQRHAYVAG